MSITLFKYRSFNEYSLKILTECTLYFAPPGSFNDPFDCRLRLLQSTDAGWLQHEASEAFRNLPVRIGLTIGREGRHDLYDTMSVSDALGLRLVNAYYDHIGKYKELDESLDDVRDAISSIGILSLSRVPDNVLMWSHYATNHQGFVCEFEVKPGEAPFEEVVEIKYNDSVYSVSATNAEDLIKNKSANWQYEKEMRALKQRFGLYSFEPSCLKRVILGCEMSIAHRLRLRDTVATSASRPELWQAEKDYQGFALTLRPVEARDFGIVTIVTRPERSDDSENVERILRRGDRTSGLVGDLRDFGYTRESVVAEADGQIVGFITCSIIEIKDEAGCRQILLMLPPAVSPKHESVEMDVRLIDMIISVCRSNGWDYLLTFGDPIFHQQFGFCGEFANAIDPRWNGPAFLGMEFRQGALKGVKGTIVFPPPWGFN